MSSNYLNHEQIDLEPFKALICSSVAPDNVPFAETISSQVVIYSADKLRAQIQQERSNLRKIQSEWHWVWQDGPGVLVIKGAFDPALVDEASEAFREIIERERGTSRGDHFAKPGANDRVWNAQEKLALLAPNLYARYYANDILAWACEAWMGPAYQITSQVNSVNPGGEAQVPHRDYHLGFMTPEQATQYPESVHRLSAHLTLQSAIAHVDMPVESGPTLLLPHSQKFSHGYLLANTPEAHEIFAQHRVQLPLEKGDLLLFSPALLHAAGSNVSRDIKRMANLLQISSAFGRAMETVDRLAMSRLVYPELLKLKQTGALNAQQIQHAVAATAEGYAFPTNLDRDPPIGGLAPKNQQALMLEALEQEWSADKFSEELDAHAERRWTS
jgi:ectoine hydroxylase-related dioxygenase (phytanoyl-CoA dioxygenase family)